MNKTLGMKIVRKTFWRILLLLSFFSSSAIAKTYHFDNYYSGIRVYREVIIEINDAKETITVMFQTANLEWQKEVFKITNKLEEGHFYRYTVKDAYGKTWNVNQNFDDNYIGMFKEFIEGSFEFSSPYKVIE